VTRGGGRSWLLLGYGREGQSTHRFLERTGTAGEVAIADRSAVTPVAPAARTHTGAGYLDAVAGYDVIVRSPGIRPDLPQLTGRVRSGGSVTSATNLFLGACPGLVVGVTGTKGKSTTSSLAASILRQRFADVRLVGNIGRPALDDLPGATPETVFVMELSSQQLVDCERSPAVAVVLAIAPEHLDFHDTYAAYAAAKARIVAHQGPGGLAVHNPAHKEVCDLVARGRGRRYRFDPAGAPAADCTVEDGWISGRAAGGARHPVLPVAEVPLPGRHNLENVLAAVSTGLALGVEAQGIRRAVAAFVPLPHRLERIGTSRGVTFYNDSLATVPQATVSAMEALAPSVATLIAGGYDRGLDYAQLGRYLRGSQVRSLILFPPSGPRIWQAVLDARPDDPPSAIAMYEVTTMRDAVGVAFDVTPPGRVCLLSPAAASYGLFRDYAERGEQFRALVSEAQLQ